MGAKPAAGDGRHIILDVPMFLHLQFNPLRRAKNTTAMLLVYLHFPSLTLNPHSKLKL
jgi:hypothetical protein